MAYRMEIHLDNEGVYNCLDDSDKERFEEAIISNVERVNDGDEVVISVTLIEKKNYDADKFLKLCEEEKRICEEEKRSNDTEKIKENIHFTVAEQS